MDMTQTLTAKLKDTAYVAVGLGVLGFQRAQVARVDLSKNLAEDTGKLQAQVKAQVEDVSGAVEAQLSDVRTQVAKAVSSLEETLEPVAKEVEDRLPESVKAVVASARQAAETAAASVRSLLAA